MSASMGSCSVHSGCSSPEQLGACDVCGFVKGFAPNFRRFPEHERHCQAGGKRYIHLEDLAHGAGYVLAVRAEARGADWPLETEVVQQHPAALVDEQGAPILVNC